MTQPEDYFPRGGIKRKSKEPQKKTHRNENLFSVNAERKKSSAQKNRENRKEKKEEDILHADLRLANVDTLSYKKLQEGMLVLGCVRKVKSLSVEVELPGRTHGQVLIKHISQPYYRELNKRLSDSNTNDEMVNLNRLLQPGQFLPTKILSIQDEEKGMKVVLSVDPIDVNSHLRHSHLKTKMLVWGAISEKYDHGYVADLGIGHCRAVLPTANIEAAKDYEVGQTFYSVVVKCESAKHATTVTLCTLKEIIEESTESSDLSLDHVIPGMQVNYTIKSVLKHGLEGTFSNECLGYINDLYLTIPLENLKNYREGQSLKARIMYVQPSTKFSYMTLRNLDRVPTPNLKIGSKLNCQVRERIGNGVVVKMNATEMGFITYKRIIKGMKSTEGDLKQIIGSKYGIGTQHHCVIIGYNNMEKMYICTFESSVLKGGFLTKDDLELGQEMEGEIILIKPQGLVVKMGTLEGFVSNLHLSSSIYSENIKAKFKVGQKIKTKVWFVDDASDNIQLTLKPELLKANNEQLVYDKKKGKQGEIVGVVAKGTKAGVLVVFFGNTRGWLPKEQIPQLGGDSAFNIFFEGQVIKCYIMNKTEERITLTLKQQQLKSEKPVKLGTIIESAKVTSVTALGLDLLDEKKGVSLFLPVEHISHTMGPTVLGTYKEEDVLEKLVCICMDDKPIVSLKETGHFLTQTFGKLVEGTILRCYYQKHIDDGISVFSPITDYRNILISNSHLGCDADVKFAPYQVLNCKILELDVIEKKKTMTVSAKMYDVFCSNYQNSFDYLEEHLSGIDFVRHRLKLAGEPLADLSLGQVVNCVVNKVDMERGCSVIIKPNEINGIIGLAHISGNIRPKNRVKAIVIGINYEHKFALLSMKENVMDKFKHIKGTPMPDPKDRSYAHLLTSDKNFAFGVDTRGHLIYLPVRLDHNDHTPNSIYYPALLNTKIKTSHCRESKGRLFGMEKDMIKILTKRAKEEKKLLTITQETSTRKRKHVVVAVKTEIKRQKLPSVSSCSDADQTAEEGESSGDEADDSPAVVGTMDRGRTKKQKHDVVTTEVKIASTSSCSEADQSEEEESSGDESDDLMNECPAVTKVINDELETGPVLPGIDTFFENAKENELKSNSSDDEDEDSQPAKKKKKMTTAEKTQVIRDEERRLLQIENELAEPVRLPQSAEQFDRVLLGNPDDSEMWLRYIAFHTQSTELEKARAVVKRALEKISYTATQDRLNVWLAYLNLENMYGTKDSFQKVFEEASRCNDSLSVYLESIRMLAEMQKFNEMEEKIKKARSKFKQELSMWLEIGKVYYKCKRFVDARKLKDAAITSITNRKTHIDLLVQFAIFEFTDGESTHGEALFETILQSDVKRVDVWCTYVDQLIKIGKTDMARDVLSRAVGQKLIYKKMRTLFKKYIAFEKAYGNEETLEHATKLLKEYTDE